jgi:hypothetical protein
MNYPLKDVGHDIQNQALKKSYKEKEDLNEKIKIYLPAGCIAF